MPVTLATGLNTLDISLTAIVITAALEGYITDQDTGQPIAGARVQVGDVASVLSGSDGKYLIPDIPAGTYTIQISAPGYQTVII
jgi:outer membrane receptor for ferrienterochelin and colicins